MAFLAALFLTSSTTRAQQSCDPVAIITPCALFQRPCSITCLLGLQSDPDDLGNCNGLQTGYCCCPACIDEINQIARCNGASQDAIDSCGATGTNCDGTDPLPLPTPRPTPQPTRAPTPRPTPLPTLAPTPRLGSPTPEPTPQPTPEPTAPPTPQPTPPPTPQPTPQPTPAPTPQPTPFPTTPRPTLRPTTSPVPTTTDDEETCFVILGFDLGCKEGTTREVAP